MKSFRLAFFPIQFLAIILFVFIVPFALWSFFMRATAAQEVLNILAIMNVGHFLVQAIAFTLLGLYFLVSIILLARWFERNFSQTPQYLKIKSWINKHPNLTFSFVLIAALILSFWLGSQPDRHPPVPVVKASQTQEYGALMLNTHGQVIAQGIARNIQQISKHQYLVTME